MKRAWAGLCRAAGWVGLALALLVAAFGARAEVAATALSLRPADPGAEIAVATSEAVPFRIFWLEKPLRFVVDFRGLVWDLPAGIAPPAPAGPVTALRHGLFRPGWSRLVIDLAAPARIARLDYAPGPEGGRVLRLLLAETDAESFRAGAGAPREALWATEGQAEALPVPRPRPVRAPGEPAIVVIDPGHGGIDPGAIREGLTEKAIVLDVARTIAARLAETGRYVPVLTREDDRFLPLGERVRIAQENQADAFLSIHINTEETGAASGVSVYSLSEEASDAAAERMAELENQADVFAGLDLDGEGSTITRVLVDLAQRDTNRRSALLAEVLLARFGATSSLIRSNPHRGAGFRVLKAPDVPSLLLEIGFLSNDGDRARMTSPEWQAALAGDIAAALDVWSEADRAARAQARR